MSPNVILTERAQCIEGAKKRTSAGPHERPLTVTGSHESAALQYKWQTAAQLMMMMISSRPALHDAIRWQAARPPLSRRP